MVWASLVAQRLKQLPGMQETQVQSLGWEDPLEKEMATHSTTLAWRIPWTEDPWWSKVHGVPRVRHSLATKQPHTLPCASRPRFPWVVPALLL